MAARGRVVSGNYYYIHDTESYHYVKKTGYLVKSPSKGQLGRWRKRWCKLVDTVMPEVLTGIPSRQVRLEYYIRDPSLSKHVPKMKGVIDLRSCVAVVKHDSNLKGHSHVFNIVTANTIFHLVAASDREREEWVAAMNDFIFTTPIYPQNYFTKSRDLQPCVYVSGAYDGDKTLWSEREKNMTYPLEKGQAKASQQQDAYDPASKSPACRKKMTADGLVCKEGSKHSLKFTVGGSHNLGDKNVSQSDEEEHDQESTDSNSELYDSINTHEVIAQRIPEQNWRDHPSICDSATVYWNDPFYRPKREMEERIRGASFLHKKRSQSSDQLFEKKNCSLGYELKLPLVNCSTLNTRWSLSSAEGTEEEDEVASEKSGLTRVVAPTAKLKAKRISVLRSLSNPTLYDASDRSNEASSKRLEFEQSTSHTRWNNFSSSESYYNVAAILAHMDYPVAPRKRSVPFYGNCTAVTSCHDTNISLLTSESSQNELKGRSPDSEVHERSYHVAGRVSPETLCEENPETSDPQLGPTRLTGGPARLMGGPARKNAENDKVAGKIRAIQRKISGIAPPFKQADLKTEEPSSDTKLADGKHAAEKNVPHSKRKAPPVTPKRSNRGASRMGPPVSPGKGENSTQAKPAPLPSASNDHKFPSVKKESKTTSGERSEAFQFSDGRQGDKNDIPLKSPPHNSDDAPNFLIIKTKLTKVLSVPSGSKAVTDQRPKPPPKPAKPGSKVTSHSESEDPNKALPTEGIVRCNTDSEMKKKLASNSSKSHHRPLLPPKHRKPLEIKRPEVTTRITQGNAPWSLEKDNPKLTTGRADEGPTRNIQSNSPWGLERNVEEDRKHRSPHEAARRAGEGSTGAFQSNAPWGLEKRTEDGPTRTVQSNAPWGLERRAGEGPTSNAPWGLERREGPTSNTPWGLERREGPTSNAPWGLERREGPTSNAPWGLERRTEEGPTRPVESNAPWGLERKAGEGPTNNAPWSLERNINKDLTHNSPFGVTRTVQSNAPWSDSPLGVTRTVQSNSPWGLERNIHEGPTDTSHITTMRAGEETTRTVQSNAPWGLDRSLKDPKPLKGNTPWSFEQSIDEDPKYYLSVPAVRHNAQSDSEGSAEYEDTITNWLHLNPPPDTEEHFYEEID